MRVFSGIQPSGKLHIGNYFGAVHTWLRLQEDPDLECFFAVVDLHALTQQPPPAELPDRVLATAADLLACGIDPERSTLFVQSHVAGHAELAWILSCLTGAGELLRMTQYKDRAAHGEPASAGLLTYPILQAADVLLYRASRVPVGEDQLQHIELIRTIARRFERATGKALFPEVEPILPAMPRILSLADPRQKMSKSMGKKHTLELTEPAEARWKKIRRAVTGAGGSGDLTDPGVQNLMALLRASAPEEVTRHVTRRLAAGDLPYRELKELLDEHLGAMLAPIQRRRRELTQGAVKEVLARGAERAGRAAADTMAEVRAAVGIGIPSLDAARLPP